MKRERSVVLWGCLCVATTAGDTARALSNRKPAAESMVTLKQGMPLSEALAALRKASGLTLLAEKSEINHTFPADETLSIPQAVERITATYRLHAVQRERSIAFQRRYVDPREDHQLERGELAATAKDLHTLLGQTGALPLTTRVVSDKVRFYQDLRPGQVQAMRGNGLPISALSAQQRTLWTQINQTQGYGDAAHSFKRLSSAFQEWSRLRLVVIPSKERSRMMLEGPRAGGQQPEKYDLGFAPARRSKQTQPSGLPALQIATSVGTASNADPDCVVFSATVPPESGERSVTQVADLLSKGGSVRLESPDWVGRHTLLVETPTGRAATLLQALCDLKGWDVRRLRAGQYRLGRPLSGMVARDAELLHAQVRLLTPPSVVLTWAKDANRARGERLERRAAAVMQEAREKWGEAWSSGAVRELSPAVQAQVAALLFDQVTFSGLARFTRRRDAPAWLARPGAGSFVIRQAQGGKPLIQFQVQREDGRIDSWGWIPGTSSLDR